MPAVTVSPVLTQGATGTPGSTAAAAAAAAAIMQNGTPTGPVGSCAVTVPSTPGGTRSELSFTSLAFSPKIAVRSFSSGESSVSPLGVIFPTSMSPDFTAAPTKTIPRSSRSTSAASDTFGISCVISSIPRLCLGHGVRVPECVPTYIRHPSPAFR